MLRTDGGHMRSGNNEKSYQRKLPAYLEIFTVESELQLLCHGQP